MNNDDHQVITAGVRIGGLNNRSEIKILLCYLVSTLNEPITEQQLIECVVGEELVNYFEMQSALAHLENTGLISIKNSYLYISDEGREISKELEGSLPFAVKERAYNTAISLLQYQTLKKQNITKITALESGGYNLNCNIKDSTYTLFSMDIFMPDEKTAKMAEEKFILNAQDIFKCVVGVTTDTPQLYIDFLNEKKSQY